MAKAMINGGGNNYTMPTGVIASTQSYDWVPRDKDIKKYLHFDRKVPIKNVVALANDPDAVSKHTFFPLLRFNVSANFSAPSVIE
ncbi:hypothetical protein [Rhizobium sp. 9140]|uniref:hypothetical protein n=1 Tax=Rhizobium sp. 9140 TaxID=1761900 RepID=UPI001112C045|nr:hypothetical protein [Rhizobium sp. 9140]